MSIVSDGRAGPDGKVWQSPSSIRVSNANVEVAVGWFVTTVALGVAVFADVGVYLLILGTALIVLMAIPGWTIWRGATKAA